MYITDYISYEHNNFIKKNKARNTSNMTKLIFYGRGEKVHSVETDNLIKLKADCSFYG